LRATQFASFQNHGDGASARPFSLFVQTNPPDIFQISLYEELYVKTGAGWIPDALEPAKVPAFRRSALPAFTDSETKHAELLARSLVPANAPVQRVRLEVLMKIGRGWEMYPMEVRVFAGGRAFRYRITTWRLPSGYGARRCAGMGSVPQFSVQRARDRPRGRG